MATGLMVRERSWSHCPKLRKHRCVAARAVHEAGDLKLLIGAMNAVIIKTESNQQTVDAKNALDTSNGRD